MAATKVQLDNLARMVPLAQAAQARFGVPASVTLAQWMIESAWGTSQLARRCNNFFGVKSLENEAYCEFSTRECVQGRSVVELAHFAFYKTAEEGFVRHAQLLASLPRYEAFMQFCRDGNLGMACRALQSGGYSTAPDYAEALLASIRQFGLTQYDVAVKPYLSTT